MYTDYVVNVLNFFAVFMLGQRSMVWVARLSDGCADEDGGGNTGDCGQGGCGGRYGCGIG